MEKHSYWKGIAVDSQALHLYADLLVVFLKRLSIFVETFFFKKRGSENIKNLGLDTQISGYHEVFILLPNFLTLLFVELVSF